MARSSELQRTRCFLAWRGALGVWLTLLLLTASCAGPAYPHLPAGLQPSPQADRLDPGAAALRLISPRTVGIKTAAATSHAIYALIDTELWQLTPSSPTWSRLSSVLGARQLQAVAASRDAAHVYAVDHAQLHWKVEQDGRWDKRSWAPTFGASDIAQVSVSDDGSHGVLIANAPSQRTVIWRWSKSGNNVTLTRADDELESLAETSCSGPPFQSLALLSTAIYAVTDKETFDARGTSHCAAVALVRGDGSGMWDELNDQPWMSQVQRVQGSADGRSLWARNGQFLDPAASRPVRRWNQSDHG